MKEWSEAVRKAVHEIRDDGKKNLLLLAEKLVERALEGDMTAMKEVGDRLDGKPGQALAITNDTRDVTELSDEELTARINGTLEQIGEIKGGDIGTGPDNLVSCQRRKYV